MVRWEVEEGGMCYEEWESKRLGIFTETGDYEL